MPRSLSAITFAPTGDTNISRSAADVLFTNDSLWVNGSFAVAAPTNPAFASQLYSFSNHSSGYGVPEVSALIRKNWTPDVNATSYVQGARVVINCNLGAGITHTNAVGDAVVGLYGQVTCQGDGSSAAPINGVAGVVNRSNGTGSVANVRALYANSPGAGSGTIGTAIGLRIDQQKQAGVTTGYGLYQQGSTDLNYFNGNVGLGQTTPTAKLHFAADTVAAGGILFGADTNLYRSAADVLRTDDSFYVASTMAVGTAPSALYSGWLYAAGTHTTGAGTPQNAALIQYDWTPTANATSTVTAAATVLNVNLGAGIAHNNGAIDAEIAIFGQIVCSGNGSTPGGGVNAVVGQVNRGTGTGTTTTTRAFLAMTPTVGAGSISTAHGVYINSQKIASVGAAYGIYQAGTADRNYFAGNIGLGVTGALAQALMFADAKNMSFGTATGTKIGSAATEKLAFWNSTPVVQNAGWSATAGYTATRTFNPEATSVTELARVVGTLVDTLKTYGLLGA
jgi:hypothetical protein